jgi:hypothetical protein
LPYSVTGDDVAAHFGKKRVAGKAGDPNMAQGDVLSLI